MFKATITNGKLLELISRTSDIVDEGTIEIKKDGLSFIAPDRAMVCVVGFNISSTAFESYELDKETKIRLNFNLLLSVLNRTTGKSKITLELNKQLKITILDDGCKREFNIPLLELSEEEMPPIDTLEFKVKAEINSEVFRNGIEDSIVIGGDGVVFSSDLKRFLMRSESDIASTELDTESKTILTKAKAKYPLDYLRKIAKTKLAENVIIEYASDYPAKFTYKNEKAEIYYIIAPRVEEIEEVEMVDKNEEKN